MELDPEASEPFWAISVGFSAWESFCFDARSVAVGTVHDHIGSWDECVVSPSSFTGNEIEQLRSVRDVTQRRPRHHGAVEFGL